MILFTRGIDMSKNRTIFLFRILPGIILVFAIINAYKQLSFKSIGNYSLFIGITLILINSWLLIVMHELGHAIFLKLKKLPIRSIFIPFFSIHFGVNTKCKISSSWASQGLVIPDIPIINNESDFIQLKAVYLKFLLAGPLATIIFYGIENFLLLIIQYFFPMLTDYCVILILHTCIQIFFLLHNCFKEYNNNIGDIIAIERVKKDNLFFASYVYCCYFFSENYKFKISECIYIKNILKENLIVMSDEQLVREVDLLDEIIYRTISGLDNYFNDFLKEKIYSIMNSLYDSLCDRNQEEHNVVSTYLHALMYIVIVCKDRNKALQLYILAEDFIQLHNPMCKYLHSQIRYLLYLETNKPKEIYPVTEYENWSFYKQYYICENSIFTAIT